MENRDDAPHESPPVRFDFPVLLPTPRLTYAPLTEQNAHWLIGMFGQDPSPFVDARFKDAAGVREYVGYQLKYARFSFNHGGGDCFFCTPEGDCAGVLHLYDLSQDTFGNRHRRCTIGFATAEAYRGQRLTSEAVGNLLRYLFEERGMGSVIAYTKAVNLPAQALLKGLQFRRHDAAYNRPDYRYFQMTHRRYRGLAE